MSKFADMPLCDLRFIASVEEAKNIEMIEDIAVLILPKDADPEVMSALTAIPKEDVASIIYLDRETTISMQNGITMLDRSFVPANKEICYALNGIVVVDEIPESTKVKLITNGILVMKEQANKSIELLTANGIAKVVEFDEYKVFPDSVTLDAESLSYLNENALIIAANTIELEDDITIDLLQQKKVKFGAGNEIKVPKELVAYVKMTAAFVGNQVAEK